MNRKPNDAELDQILAQFRASVHGWSAQQYAEADLPSPFAVRRRSHLALRIAAAAAAVVMVAVSPFLIQHHAAQPTTAGRHAAPAAGAVAQTMQESSAETGTGQSATALPSGRAAERQLPTAAAISDEDLMAAVDADVSQRSPDAMSPLVELMSSDSSKTSTKD